MSDVLCPVYTCINTSQLYCDLYVVRYRVRHLQNVLKTAEITFKITQNHSLLLLFVVANLFAAFPRYYYLFEHLLLLSVPLPYFSPISVVTHKRVGLGGQFNELYV